MKSHPHNEFKRINLLAGVFIILLLAVLALVMLQEGPETRYVLLSFDVEPVDGTESVMDVLDVVYRQEVDATFFVTGEYADSHPEIVKLMTGREIGCHGYSHTAFTSLNRSEKRKELLWCKEVLPDITGRDVIGFRAPYNLVDHDTLVLLDELGFAYDASMIDSWTPAYPRVDASGLGEIPVSSVMLVPMEDVSWIHYLGMERAFFYIIKHKQGNLESYLFHPRLIAQYKNEFEEFIKYLKDDGAIFISHQQLTKT